MPREWRHRCQGQGQGMRRLAHTVKHSVGAGRGVDGAMPPAGDFRWHVRTCGPLAAGAF